MAARGIKWNIPAGFIFLMAVSLIPGAASATSAKIRLFPDQVEVGTFFDGAEVSFDGEIPAGTEAVVEIQGAAGHQELLRKGRRGGLWMSVGEIRVENAPSLYLVLSSTPGVPQLKGQETPWGLPALKSRISFHGALQDREKDRFFQEFLELKKSEDLYGTFPGGLKTGKAQEGEMTLKGNCLLPAKVPPGKYQVRLTVIKDGQVLEQKNEALEVKMVGFPALLASMTYEHGLFHGILAVLIAIATGFIMGFLFKGKAEH